MEPCRNSPMLWRNLLPPLQESTTTTVATLAAVTTVKAQFYVPAFCIFLNFTHSLYSSSQCPQDQCCQDHMSFLDGSHKNIKLEFYWTSTTTDAAVPAATSIFWIENGGRFLRKSIKTLPCHTVLHPRKQYPWQHSSLQMH